MAPDVFPEGICLVDKMMGTNGQSVPTASEALSELRIIKTRLNEDALQFYFPGSLWGRGTSKGAIFSWFVRMLLTKYSRLFRCSTHIVLTLHIMFVYVRTSHLIQCFSDTLADATLCICYARRKI